MSFYYKNTQPGYKCIINTPYPSCSHFHVHNTYKFCNAETDTIYLGQRISINASKLREKNTSAFSQISEMILLLSLAFWVPSWPQINSFNCLQCLHIAAFSPSPGFNHCFLLTGLNYVRILHSQQKCDWILMFLSMYLLNDPGAMKFFTGIANFITAIINKELNLNTQNSR